MREANSDAEIKEILTLIMVKGIGDRRYNASEYVILKMYLPGGNGAVALIERELYIVDNLTAKALIGIDIIKLEGIMIDLQRDIIRIGAYRGLEVPIIVASRGSRTTAIIYSSKKLIIPPYLNIAVLVIGPKKRLQLPKDRDFIFEPQTLDTLSAYVYIVDYTVSSVFVRNDTDKPVTLPRRQKLGKVSDYKVTDCYAVDPENYELAIKVPKRQPG